MKEWNKQISRPLIDFTGMWKNARKERYWTSKCRWRATNVNSGKAGSKFTQAIDAETKRVTNDEDWRERYVTWEMDLKIIQEDAEKKGEKRGEKKGRLAGKKEKAIEIAKSLKEKGKLSDSEIAEVTALPLREVAALWLVEKING